MSDWLWIPAVLGYVLAGVIIVAILVTFDSDDPSDYDPADVALAVVVVVMWAPFALLGLLILPGYLGIRIGQWLHRFRKS